jgi:hypothetical protein
VIAAGAGVTRFAVGDDVFGHFLSDSWAPVHSPCARTAADGPQIELRPDRLDPLAAVGLAQGGLTAKTILRAAGLGRGQSALVVGATSATGIVLVPLLAEAGVRVIAGAAAEDDEYVLALGAAETVEETAEPVADGLARHPDVDLVVDLVSFGEPYFITHGATTGTLVTSLAGDDADAGAHEPGLTRMTISAEPGDLVALAQRVLDGRQPIDVADVDVSPGPARGRRGRLEAVRPERPLHEEDAGRWPPAATETLGRRRREA